MPVTEENELLIPAASCLQMMLKDLMCNQRSQVHMLHSQEALRNTEPVHGGRKKFWGACEGLWGVQGDRSESACQCLWA